MAETNNIELDPLVARYGRKIAQAELEAEIAEQTRDQAIAYARDLEAQVADLTRRIDELEGDVGAVSDGLVTGEKEPVE